MRIGLFTDSYLPRMDGIAISAESCRVGLEALGHTVYVFCPKRPELFTEPTDRIYRFPSIPSVTQYDQYRDTFPFTPKHLYTVSRLKFDIIHVYTQAQVGLFGTFIAKRNHIPLVTTCTSDFSLFTDYKRLRFVLLPMFAGITIATQSFVPFKKLRAIFSPKYPVGSWVDRSISTFAGFYNDQCDITTVPSIKMLRAIGPYMQKKPVIVPCGIDLRLVPKDEEKNLRKRYSLPEDKILFVSASRLVREKRIDFIIRSFANLSFADKKKSVLVIVGDGDDLYSLKQLVIRLGVADNVIFLGRLEHKKVLEVMKACDIYLHASLRETQGLVLNEAAACGKPLIMIDRDVNDILHDGKNGLFAQDSILSFSNAMTKLLNDKRIRDQFGKKSEEYAQRTDLKDAAKHLETLYRTLIHN